MSAMLYWHGKRLIKRLWVILLYNIGLKKKPSLFYAEKYLKIYQDCERDYEKELTGQAYFQKQNELLEPVSGYVIECPFCEGEKNSKGKKCIFCNGFGCVDKESAITQEKHIGKI